MDVTDAANEKDASDAKVNSDCRPINTDTQTAWVQAVGGLGYWEPSQEMDAIFRSCEGRARLQGQLHVLSRLALTQPESGTVSAVIVMMNQGGLTFPAKAAVKTLVSLDTRLLADSTQESLHRRGDQWNNWLRQDILTDEHMLAKFKHAVSRGVKNPHSYAGEKALEHRYKVAIEVLWCWEEQVMSALLQIYSCFQALLAVG